MRRGLRRSTDCRTASIRLASHPACISGSTQSYTRTLCLDVGCAHARYERQNLNTFAVISQESPETRFLSFCIEERTNLSNSSFVGYRMMNSRPHNYNVTNKYIYSMSNRGSSRGKLRSSSQENFSKQKIKERAIELD